MTEHTALTRRRTLAGVAGAGAVALAPNPAAASNSQGFFDGPVVNGENSSTFDVMLASAVGLASRARLRFSDLKEAEQLGRDIQEHFNPRSGDYLDYVNERDLGGSERQVFEITLVQDDHSDTRFLVADYDDDQYASAEIMDSSAFNDLDREADEETLLSGQTAANAPEELEELYDDFIEPNEDITSEWAAQKASTYAGPHLSSTLLGDDL